MPPAKIMVIRHAEKPIDGKPLGLRTSGKADPESLTTRGWQRAGALARFLAPADGRLAHPALATPTAIVASRAEPGAGASRRPKQTVKPLAELLGLAIDLSFGKDEEPAMVASLLAREGVVLVSWVHEGIPPLVAALPGAPPVPAAWPEDRFDVVWVLDPAPASGWTLTQVPERLLAGDRDDGIAF
jgi:hypothetical protein